MKKLLFYFAATGWALGLIINLLAWFDIDVSEYLPFIWVLHIGIFIVWIPAIIQLKKKQRPALNIFPAKPFTLIKSITHGVPQWLVSIAIAGFVYAFINFGLFILQLPGTPDIKDGHYILQNHGQLLRQITEKEYHHYKAVTIRGFSGHWIFFYGLAAAMLYPFAKNDELENLHTSWSPKKIR
jgi:hypothetical protein